jgi:Rod binding domain-containing protein
LAISPPSDIVLDVARAVDPAGLESARMALEKRASVAGTGVTGAAGAAFPSLASAGLADGREAAAASGKDKPGVAKVYQRFEAVVLQNFLQSIMPKNSEAVFGSGLSGDMWKSELAEQLANVMAKRGGIGIANRLLKERYAEGDKTLPLTGVSAGAHKAEADMQHSLSIAMVQDLQRKLTRPIGAEAPASDTTSTTRL